jgi:hypothetical protein
MGQLKIPGLEISPDLRLKRRSAEYGGRTFLTSGRSALVQRSTFSSPQVVLCKCGGVPYFPHLR